MTDRATETLPTLYTPEDVAKLLGRSGWWVREQCRRDRFPHTRAAGAIRFTREQIDEILKILERRPDPSKQGVAAGRSPRRNTLAKGGEVQLRARPPRKERSAAVPDEVSRRRTA